LSAIGGLAQSAHSTILLVTNGLSLLLGIGLILRNEFARMIFIWLTVVFGILLKVPVLIFFTSSFNPYHDVKFVVVALVGLAINLIAVIYLSLPHVKEQFS
jgi:hypothetical protein